jgi:hypothetical protein
VPVEAAVERRMVLAWDRPVVIATHDVLRGVRIPLLNGLDDRRCPRLRDLDEYGHACQGRCSPNSGICVLHPVRSYGWHRQDSQLRDGTCPRDKAFCPHGRPPAGRIRVNRAAYSGRARDRHRTVPVRPAVAAHRADRRGFAPPGAPCRRDHCGRRFLDPSSRCAAACRRSTWCRRTDTCRNRC